MIRDAHAQAIVPALALLPAQMTSHEAELMLLAIGLQESGLVHRRQIGGPARGLLQFETGGVRGALTHEASREHARRVCAARGVEPTTAAVYARLEHDDVLAMAIGRLLLWTDPKPLPELCKADEAWSLYLRTWRPGKPHRNRWDACYAAALREIREFA